MALGRTWLHRRSRRDPADVVAGVMVLSEVAKRLMMMSGPGASTCAAECRRTATSRLNEVATTTVPPGHRWPGEPGRQEPLDAVMLP